MMRAAVISLAIPALALAARHSVAQADPLKVGVFDVDASPPIGSPMAYDPTKEVTTPLRCRGIVLLGESLSAARIGCIALIVIGILGLKILGGESAA